VSGARKFGAAKVTSRREQRRVVLARRIKARRIELGLTQEQLAVRAGVSRRHMEAIEQAQGFTLKLLDLPEWAVALEVQLDWFVPRS
jgi:transcriptional regulator with XRE-family HTH domain